VCNETSKKHRNEKHSAEMRSIVQNENFSNKTQAQAQSTNLGKARQSQDKI
jgi:hypothetical protein